MDRFKDIFETRDLANGLFLVPLDNRYCYISSQKVKLARLPRENQYLCYRYHLVLNMKNASSCSICILNNAKSINLVNFLH